jgi:hypothetical protein
MSKSTAQVAKGSIAGKGARKIATTAATQKAQTATKAKITTAKKAAPKMTAEQADKIKVYKKANVNSADSLLMVQAADGRVVTFDEQRMTRQLTALAKVGASFAAVADYVAKHGKQAPVLARGVASNAAPHSAKSVADARGSAKAAQTAKPASAKPAKTASVAKSALDGALAIKLTAKGIDKLKVGGSTGSIKNLTLLSKSATVAKALANGLKGADITYAAKTGTITLG